MRLLATSMHSKGSPIEVGRDNPIEVGRDNHAEATRKM